MATLKYKDPVTGEVKRVGIGGDSGGSADTSDSVIEQNKREEQKFWVGTKAEFDAIATKDNNTMYVVTDEPVEDNPGGNAQIEDHNVDPEAHADIREMITNIPGGDYLPLSGGTMTGQIKMEDVSDPAQGTRFYANQGFGISVQADIEDDTSARYGLKLNLPSVELTKALGLMRTDEEGNTKAYYIYGDHNKPTAGDVVGIVNPNLLDNWYFGNPVNQRGQTEYNYGGGYTIDRWKDLSVTGSKNLTVSVQDDFVKLVGAEQYAQFAQVFERKGDFSGKTVTVSMLVRGNATNKRVIIYDGTTYGQLDFTPSSETEWELVKLTTTLPTTYTGSTYLGIRIYPSHIAAPNNDWLDVLAVKLELGSQQTLAHQDASGNWVLNEIPDYGEQLARCRRYFERVTAKNNNMSLGMGSGTASDLYIPIQVAPKRANPAAFVGTQITEGLRVGTNLLNTVPGADNVTFYSIDNESGRYTLLIKGTWTAGTAYRMGLVVGTYLDFNADL